MRTVPTGTVLGFGDAEDARAAGVGAAVTVTTVVVLGVGEVAEDCAGAGVDELLAGVLLVTLTDATDLADVDADFVPHPAAAHTVTATSDKARRRAAVRRAD